MAHDDVVAAISDDFRRDLDGIMSRQRRRGPAAQLVMRDGTTYELTTDQARRAIAAALKSPELPGDDALARAARNAKRPVRLG